MSEISAQSEQVKTSGESGEKKVIVSAVDVDKIYTTGQEDLYALNKLNLRIEEGEILAVMGASGSGKTTLLNILSGLDQASSGEIYIAGNNIAHLSDNALTEYRARHMGFIFQSYNLLPVLSAQENVEMAAFLAGASLGKARSKAQEKLRLVNMQDRLRHKPAELSGGQQQRVTIARALVNDPEIIWADEPTGNLDTANEADIMDLMVKLNRENNQTFVLVTHSDRVAKIANRVVIMEDGRIIDERVQ